MNRRKCPGCETDHLVSIKEATTVFDVNKWGATNLLVDASRVCSWCHAVKLGTDDWDRLESVDQRAYDLSQTGSKSKSEYRDRLTVGKLPSPDESNKVVDTEEDW